MWQIGVWRTNHNWEFCYRYYYAHNCIQITAVLLLRYTDSNLNTSWLIKKECKANGISFSSIPLWELKNKGKVFIISPKSVCSQLWNVCLQEQINTEFVWEFQQDFVILWMSCLLMRVSIKRASFAYIYFFCLIKCHKVLCFRCRTAYFNICHSKHLLILSNIKGLYLKCTSFARRFRVQCCSYYFLPTHSTCPVWVMTLPKQGNRRNAYCISWGLITGNIVFFVYM